MADFKHVLSVYSLLELLLLVTPWNDCFAESPFRETQSRVNPSHIQKNRQDIGRAPNAIHSSPKSAEEKAGRPIVGGQHTPPINNATGSPETITNFPGRPIRNPSVIDSTLSGRVEKWVGNFQPSRKESNINNQKKPLKTKIYVFKGKLKSNGNPELALSQEITNKVFAILDSNSNGDFRVQLPPGEYTIFAEISGKLYRNSFDGEGYFSTTQIEDGKSTQELIIDSSQANF